MTLIKTFYAISRAGSTAVCATLQRFQKANDILRTDHKNTTATRLDKLLRQMQRQSTTFVDF